MENWTYLDQMEFESDLRDSAAEADYCKLGSKLYIMDSIYSDLKKEDEDEVCDPFF